MFLSLGLIVVMGFLGGFLFEKIRMPKIVWYLLLGIILGPSLLNLLDGGLLNISSYLRQIALVIIISRSGLSLDWKGLKKIGRTAILMCFLPATLEMIGVMLFSVLILKVSLFEGLLLGAVLAAVSPAIVVPRMIEAKKKGYNPHVCEVILAGSSCDDVYVIVLFYAFLGLVKNNTFTPITLLQIPSSIILGVLLGVIGAILLYYLFKLLKTKTVINVILMLGTSFLFMGIEEILKPYVSVSALLGIMSMGIILASKAKKEAIEMEASYQRVWNFFEIILFALVGATVNLNYALSINGLYALIVIVLGLCFRMLGVYLCFIKSPFHKKERLYMMLSYLPKATVQASIGSIALMEGLAVGEMVLTTAVISILFTAPLGAILMDQTRDKLLTKTSIEP